VLATRQRLDGYSEGKHAREKMRRPFPSPGIGTAHHLPPRPFVLHFQILQATYARLRLDGGQMPGYRYSLSLIFVAFDFLMNFDYLSCSKN
jgi:hypothetical protein